MDTNPHETIGRLKNQLKEKDKEINALKEQVRLRNHIDEFPENNNELILIYFKSGSVITGYYAPQLKAWVDNDFITVDRNFDNPIIGWLPIPELNK